MQYGNIKVFKQSCMIFLFVLRNEDVCFVRTFFQAKKNRRECVDRNGVVESLWLARKVQVWHIPMKRYFYCVPRKRYALVSVISNRAGKLILLQ